MLPALATVGRPVAAAATVVLAALPVLAVLADPVVRPPVSRGPASSSRGAGRPARVVEPPGSSLAIGVPAVLAPAVAAIPAGEPYLVYVPIALVVGLAIMFVHQIVRRDGRPRLTESAADVVLGPLGHRPRHDVDAAVAQSPRDRGRRRRVRRDRVARPGRPRRGLRQGATVDAARRHAARRCRARSPRLPCWGTPTAALAVFIGFLCAAVAHAARRMLSVLPAITSVRAQLSSAVPVPGVVAYGLALAIVG